MSKTLDQLKDLCQIDGVSGYENKVRDYIKNQLEGICEMSVDARGNLICFKKGKSKPASKIMLSAHMDEVGFIITHIDENGLLRFSTVGKIDSRVAIGKPVMLENQVYGVIGSKPIHLLESGEADKPVDFDDLYIDIGADSREDAEKSVSLGDYAVFHSAFQKLGDYKLKGKAIDNRAGCAVLMSLLRQDLKYDVTVVFTTLEEIDGGSAGNAAYQINPDIGIVVETTCAADVPDVPSGKQCTVQGKGPALSFRDGKTVYDIDLYRRAMKVAEKKEIPCQPKKVIAGGNESRSVQITKGGVRVLAVSMPGRYLHSPSCVIDKRDIKSTVHLLEALVNDFGSNPVGEQSHD